MVWLISTMQRCRESQEDETLEAANVPFMNYEKKQRGLHVTIAPGTTTPPTFTPPGNPTHDVSGISRGKNSDGVEYCKNDSKNKTLLLTSWALSLRQFPKVINNPETSTSAIKTRYSFILSKTFCVIFKTGR